jgi:hypothetical protein
MKTDTAANQLETRAAEALKALLGQLSGIKLKELKRASHASGRAVEIRAQVDVFGHNHTLACEVSADATPDRLRKTLRSRNDGDIRQATPVIIAPYLSPEAQDLCKRNHAGFLDLEGNARLALGEVFIGTRALGSRAARA